MQKISTFLTFDNQAEDAVHFYTSVFENAAITKTIAGPNNTVLGLSFTLDGQEFMALNGGPYFTFTNGISLFVHCTTQEEIDDKWAKLSDGGEPMQCGWLRDRYGVHWQIVPPVLGELLQSSDAGIAKRVMEAMLSMTKIDIAALERAAKGV